jgi:hypothetical protein
LATAALTLAQSASPTRTVDVTDSLEGFLGSLTAADTEPFARKVFTYSRTVPAPDAGTCEVTPNTVRLATSPGAESTGPRQTTAQVLGSDSADVEVCLDPTPTTSPTPAPTPTPTTQLPRTGAVNLGGLTMVSLLAIALGGMMVGVSRRRRAQ